MMNQQSSSPISSSSYSVSGTQEFLHPVVIPVEGPPSVKVTRHNIMLESTCRSDDRRFSSNFVPVHVSTSLQQSVSVLDTQDENITGTCTSVHSHSLSTIPEANQASVDLSGPETSKKILKKGRVVASRYKSGPKNPPSRFHTGNTSAVLTAATSSSGKTHKTDKFAVKSKSEMKAANSSAKKSNQHLRHAQQLASPQLQPFTPAHKPISLHFTPSSMTTSTPAHTQHATPAFQLISVGDTNVSSDVGELQTELILARLLQASYLDIMSAKSLRLQEEEAKSQLHRLWQCVLEEKDETTSLEKIIETKERTLALEKAIEIQLHHLGPANSDLHALEQQYSCMAKALDATRYDMACRRISPCSEDELNTQLGLSEHLLSDIADSIGRKSLTVSSLTDLTETLLGTSEQQHQELQVCWEEFDSLLNNEVSGTSLFFEQEQRNCLL